MSPELVAALAKTGLWVFALLQVAPVMLWLERRAPAFMQDRLGPNRVGPLGLLQGIADAVKFIFKEDTIPSGADRGLFLAPGPSFGPYPTHVRVCFTSAAPAVVRRGIGVLAELLGRE